MLFRSQAFDNDNVNERTARRWFAKFRSGDFSLEDEPRGCRPAVMQDEDLRTLVETDSSQTVMAWDGGRIGRQFPCCF